MEGCHFLPLCGHWYSVLAPIRTPMFKLETLVKLSGSHMKTKYRNSRGLAKKDATGRGSGLWGGLGVKTSNIHYVHAQNCQTVKRWGDDFYWEIVCENLIGLRNASEATFAWVCECKPEVVDWGEKNTPNLLHHIMVWSSELQRQKEQVNRELDWHPSPLLSLSPMSEEVGRHG